MKSTGQKLILESFVLALLAAGAFFIYLKSLEKPQEAIKNTTLLVAAKTIPARTQIDKSMITTVEVADSSLFNDDIKDASRLIGKYTKETILKNEGFHKDKIIDNEEEELSLKIDSKHRAVTINAAGDSGVAHLIKPGDFVDIVAYLSEKTDGVKIIRPDLAKIILQNIEVLAIDKQLTREAEKNDQETEKKTEETNTFLVTLSVKTEEIEKLVLAENIGNLKLALRPLKETETETTSAATWEELTVDQEQTKQSVDGNLAAKAQKSDESSKSDENNENDEAFITYAVKRGDTLRSISKTFYGDGRNYNLLKAINHIENENVIRTGTVIKIPILKE